MEGNGRAFGWPATKITSIVHHISHLQLGLAQELAIMMLDAHMYIPVVIITGMVCDAGADDARNSGAACPAAAGTYSCPCSSQHLHHPHPFSKWSLASGLLLALAQVVLQCPSLPGSPVVPSSPRQATAGPEEPLHLRQQSTAVASHSGCFVARSSPLFAESTEPLLEPWPCKSRACGGWEGGGCASAAIVVPFCDWESSAEQH